MYYYIVLTLFVTRNTCNKCTHKISSTVPDTHFWKQIIVMTEPIIYAKTNYRWINTNVQLTYIQVIKKVIYLYRIRTWNHTFGFECKDLTTTNNWRLFKQLYFIFLSLDLNSRLVSFTCYDDCQPYPVAPIFVRSIFDMYHWNIAQLSTIRIEIVL